MSQTSNQRAPFSTACTQPPPPGRVITPAFTTKPTEYLSKLGNTVITTPDDVLIQLPPSVPTSVATSDISSVKDLPLLADKQLNSLQSTVSLGGQPNLAGVVLVIDNADTSVSNAISEITLVGS